MHIRLPDEHSIAALQALLGEIHLHETEPTHKLWTFYDTFDWLLFAKSLTLYQSDHELILHSLSEDTQVQRIAASTVPTFARDLPECALKDQLEDIVKARALLALTAIHTHSKTYLVLNREEKTVARLVQIDTRALRDAGDHVNASYLSVLAVRGYPKHATELEMRMAYGKQVPSVIQDVFYRTLEAAGQEPGSYTSKLEIDLHPQMRSDEATRTILRRLLEIMLANESGIQADIDVEFLHDYRVAIRKTRSALGLIRHVFPAHITKRFKQEFRKLGKATNRLRDLDVYLLAEPAYRDMLPDEMREDIEPLFEFLRTQRTHALHEVLEVLNSPNTTRVLEEWTAFLNGRPSVSTDEANASVRVIDLARRRIFSTYKRILADGKYAVEHNDDDLLHALRIECKKLRYLLEFFASLFPPKKINRLVRQLKRLQDNLGEFTDLSVQREHLIEAADQLPIEDPRTRGALVATGALVQSVAARQQIAKSDFNKTFTKFASPKNQKQYRKLFGKQGK